MDEPILDTSLVRRFLDSWLVVVPVALSVAILTGSFERMLRRMAEPRVRVAASVRASPEPSRAASPRQLDLSSLARAFSLPAWSADDGLSELATEARIVPAFRDNAPIGFKVFSIRPDSFYAKVGIRNGDVIRRINGVELSSPDRALDAYSQVKSTRHLELEIERNGVSFTQTLLID